MKSHLMLLINSIDFFLCNSIYLDFDIKKPEEWICFALI
jgi:hypothetical protein